MIIRIVSIIMCCMVLLSPNRSLANNVEKVALVVKALSNPFFITMRDGAVQYAQKKTASP